jgi:hypothetical protein
MHVTTLSFTASPGLVAKTKLLCIAWGYFLRFASLF